jgi:DNA polymerase-1
MIKYYNNLNMVIYLIDGSSYVYRAFFAIRGLSTSKGLPTNAIYGVTNMLLKIINEKKPDGIAVVFDRPEPTRRHKTFEEYKAQRPKAPDELVVQLPYIRRIVKAFGIKVIELPGYEADDILATLATRLSSYGADVYIVSGDKDILQIVNHGIKMFDPMKNVVYDREAVIERYGLSPERIPELMALTGDSIDNIPGIKGIGEKTGLEILRSARLNEIIENPDLIKKEKLRRLIKENIEILKLSYDLALIDRNVPVNISAEELKRNEPDWPELLEIFRECEFSSLMKLLPVTLNVKPIVVREIREIPDTEIRTGFAFDILYLNSIQGIALAPLYKGKVYYLPLSQISGNSPTVTYATDAVEDLVALFSNREIPKVSHNLKKDILTLRRVGIELDGRLDDTEIASYILNPLRPNHDLDELVIEYLGEKKLREEDIRDEKDRLALASQNALCKARLYEIFKKRISEEGLEYVYNEIELPLIKVLADMEEAGVKIDTELLKNISKELEGVLDGLRQRIYLLAGEEFNINSPKQLSTILFDKLGLKPRKRTKTGYSTEVSVLEELALIHELPREILNYRSLFKLKTTYVDTLPELINPATGRLHTSFNQTVTATGRLSSSEPNLQNIPIRGTWGERIRQAFIVEPGYIMLSADYSQIELRILAHMSRDEGFVKAFKEGLDIHNATAMELFGVESEKVTPEMRRIAKTVNFGIIYGMTAFGLSETLGIQREEAQVFIDQFFMRHPAIKEFSVSLIKRAEEKGYAETLFGRKRPIPELKSRQGTTRSLGERLAINSPIQGTASDIIKLAMIKIWKLLKEGGFRTRMLLQIHDELLFEVPEEELTELKDRIRKEMERVVELEVPLSVNISTGKNWAEAG